MTSTTYVRRLAPVACAIAIACFASTSSAALLHSDVMGDDVWFTMIEESSPSGDPLPLYGQPTAIGNTLDFNPTGNFAAQSTDLDGTDITDGKLSLMVRAKDGFALTSFEVAESGLATLFTLDGNPFAGVLGLVEIDIVGIDGAAVTPIDLTGVSMSFTPAGGSYLHSDVNDSPIDSSFPPAGPLFSTGWSGGVSVDLDAVLDGLGIDYDLGVTKINVTLNNQLISATTQLGESAFIDKKDFDIIVETRVPEPTSITLALLGLGMVLAYGRRAKRSR